MFRIPWLLVVILVFVRSEPEKNQDGPTKTAFQSVQPGQPRSPQPPVLCYACTDCQKVSNNTTVKICPYDSDYSKQKCITYVEKYKYLDKPWYVRGCVSERGDCLKIRRAHEDIDGLVVLSSCNECEGDKCNGGLSSFPAAFLSLVVTPVLAKLALS